MAKADKKGRSSAGPRFQALYHYMTDSAAWASLTPADRAVYLEVAKVFNGSNNGFLARSVRQLADLANCNKDTATKSLAVLVDRGFLERARDGGFGCKVRIAAEWRLTCERCDRTGKPPSKAFMKWTPKVQKTVRNKGTDCPKIGDRPRSNRSDCPKIGDRNGQKSSMNGPKIGDTYTSNHIQGSDEHCGEEGASGAVQAKRSSPTPPQAHNPRLPSLSLVSTSSRPLQPDRESRTIGEILTTIFPDMLNEKGAA